MLAQNNTIFSAKKFWASNCVLLHSPVLYDKVTVASQSTDPPEIVSRVLI